MVAGRGVHMDLRNKMDLISSVIDNMRGSTGDSFESKVHIILSRYYKYIGKEFSHHRSWGGEKGNDGWVKDDCIFYQVYAPLTGGTKSSIFKKFKNNLNKLLNAVINDNKYGGSIKEYFFIVNTMDQGLPPDEDGVIDVTTTEMSEKYNVKIQCSLHNLDYVQNLLESIDDEIVLGSIAYYVKAPVLNDLGRYTLHTKDILEYFEGLLKNIEAKNDFISTEFDRIPLASKIETNDLQSVKDSINIVASKLDVVENARKILDDPVPRINSIIAYYVSAYQEAIQKDLVNIDAYSNIIKSAIEVAGKNYEAHAEYVLVYILNRCEIFEKE